MLKAGWNSNWRPLRDFLAVSLTVVFVAAPGIYYLSQTLTEFATMPMQFWTSPNPNGAPLVFGRTFGKNLFATVWLGVVLVLFGSPLAETYHDAF